MIKSLMASSIPLNLAMAGLILFCLIFISIVFWTFRKGSKKKYKTVSQLPLDTEEKHD